MLSSSKPASYASSYKSAFAKLRGDVGSLVAKQVAAIVIQEDELMSEQELTSKYRDITQQYFKLARDVTMPFRQRKAEMTRLSQERNRIAANAIVLMSHMNVKTQVYDVETRLEIKRIDQFKSTGDAYAAAVALDDVDVLAQAVWEPVPDDVCWDGCKCCELCTSMTHAKEEIVAAQIANDRALADLAETSGIAEVVNEFEHVTKDIASVAANLVMPRKARDVRLAELASIIDTLQVKLKFIVARTSGRSRSACELSRAIRDYGELRRRHSVGAIPWDDGDTELSEKCNSEHEFTGAMDATSVYFESMNSNHQILCAIIPDEEGRTRFCKLNPSLAIDASAAISRLGSPASLSEMRVKVPSGKILVLQDLAHLPRTGKLLGVYALRGLYERSTLPVDYDSINMLKWEENDGDRTSHIRCDIDAAHANFKSASARRRDKQVQRAKKPRGRARDVERWRVSTPKK
jgi:hypothetical protein